jgi:hypothetical protein
MFAPHQLGEVRWICGSSLAKTSGRTAAGGLEGSGGDERIDDSLTTTT